MAGTHSWTRWKTATKAVLNEYFWESLAGVIVNGLELKTDQNGAPERWRTDTRAVLTDYVEDFLADILLNEIDETYTHELAAAATM